MRMMTLLLRIVFASCRYRVNHHSAQSLGVRRGCPPRQVMDPSWSQITIPAENSHASSTFIELKVSCRRSLLVARRTANCQELRLAIAHSRDRSALSDSFCFIICPADDGEHCDATIVIRSTIGAANLAGPPLRRVTVYRDIHLIVNRISGNRVRAHSCRRAGVLSFACGVDNSEDRSAAA